MFKPCKENVKSAWALNFKSESHANYTLSSEDI